MMKVSGVIIFWKNVELRPELTWASCQQYTGLLFINQHIESNDILIWTHILHVCIHWFLCVDLVDKGVFRLTAIII